MTTQTLTPMSAEDLTDRMSRAVSNLSGLAVNRRLVPEAQQCLSEKAEAVQTAQNLWADLTMPQEALTDEALVEAYRLFHDKITDLLGEDVSQGTRQGFNVVLGFIRDGLYASR